MIELYFAYGIANSKAGPYIAVFFLYIILGVIITAIAQEITRNRNGIRYENNEWMGGIVFWPLLIIFLLIRLFYNVIIGIFNLLSFI